MARQGKLQEALKDYDRAIELVPSAADPHLNRGAVYESLGRLEEALKDYDVVLPLGEKIEFHTHMIYIYIYCVCVCVYT